MTTQPAIWRSQRRSPILYRSEAARLKATMAFLRYRSSVRRDLQKRADDMHDYIEIWVNEGGADGEDAR